jgi:hypothetical protein
MSNLLYLYELKKNLEQSLTTINRAIEAQTTPSGYTGPQGFQNVDTNGNYCREDFTKDETPHYDC